VLTDEELQRYSRQLLLPELGQAGQEKLKQARVLIVGMGGLGTPLALYLAAAGVGTLGLVDDTNIELSNLHRQVLFGTDSIGKSKLDIAREKLFDLNPNCNIRLHTTRLDSSNALEIFREYDVVADATDNFPSRYLINDACVLTGIPNVYGSVFKFDGQVSVFGARDSSGKSTGPCYRCLYPIPPTADLIPSCAAGGVLGVLPGIIGLMQGTEVLKIILGVGEPLIGALLLFDALRMDARKIRIQRNISCVVCANNPTVHKLIDYKAFCGDRELMNNPEISVQDYSAMRARSEDHFLLDVREPFEREIASIGGTLIPTGEVASRLNELPHDKPIIVYCHLGIRSLRVQALLQSAGFTNPLSLKGGTAAWSDAIDPTVAKY
jgi:molybdopterin/thiamine biosynthesis adenylyltransferase/rhodanese-related sulfurtransferase